MVEISDIGNIKKLIVISNNELVIIDDEVNVHIPIHEGTFTFLD